MRPSYEVRVSEEVPERYVVTFHRDATHDGLSILGDKLGLRDFIHAGDFDDGAVVIDDEKLVNGAVFGDLDICVVHCPKTLADRISAHAPRSAIMAVEPEQRMHAMTESLDVRDLSHPQERAGESREWIDSANESWGIQSTGVAGSSYLGHGIRVAILDTGIDVTHPDFNVADLASTQGFIGNGVDDANGHGTHCAGTICGPRQPANAPTYGVAPRAELFVGKVVDDRGNGRDRSLLAGLNWAIANRCAVVSLSIGASVPSPSTAFEQVGQRALAAGTLIVAAAGNNSRRMGGDFGYVVRPANNRSIMAVGAVGRDLCVAEFSSRSSRVSGGEVDIVGPGVDVFSAWPQPQKYRSISGTSMAAPFVAGIAALHAQAYNVRGLELWDVLTKSAKPLPISTVDVGAGLVQAPGPG